MPNIIQTEIDEGFECHCGNTSHGKGFFPCDWDGTLVEPGLHQAGEGWNNLWYCDNCKQIYYDKGR